MSRRWLYLERLDVARDLEPLFNELYAGERLPALAGVPGVVRATRYRHSSPTDPRYMAAFELERSDVVGSPAWRSATAAGRFASAIWPHTMNRHEAVYAWVGSAATLTHTTPNVFWVMMDVEPHREGLFNELYDEEHIPLLMKLPGSVNTVRYRTDAPGEPRYLAVYEVDRADLPMSPAWASTSDIGRWKPEVRPYTYNKRFIVSERLV